MNNSKPQPADLASYKTDHKQNTTEIDKACKKCPHYNNSTHILNKVSLASDTKKKKYTNCEMTYDLYLAVQNIALPAANDDKFWKSKKSEYVNLYVDNELSAIESKGAYNSYRMFWISAWGNISVTSAKYSVAPNAAEKFSEQKILPGEFNFQFNAVKGIKNKIVLFGSLEYNVYNNNSIKAELESISEITKEQYLQLPPTSIDTFNLAILSSNKTYLGFYENFITNKLKLSLVGMWTANNYFSIGISTKVEKLFGKHSPWNISIGFPIKLQGKEQPINIEPQVRLNDLSNYTNKEKFKVNPTFGINVGLPFIPLYK